VYFDTLAPNWDKHPCTDTTAWSAKPEAEKEAARAIAFARVKTQPHKATSKAILDTAIGDGWVALRIRFSEEHANPPLLVVKRIDEPEGKRLFVEVHGKATRLEIGRVIFWKEDVISYFDVNLFEPADRKVTVHPHRPNALSKKQRRKAKRANAAKE
jgi:hypothetical protein